MAQEELQESKLTKAGGRKPTHGCNYPMVGWPSVILTPLGPSLNLTREGTSRPSLRSSLSLSHVVQWVVGQGSPEQANAVPQWVVDQSLPYQRLVCCYAAAGGQLQLLQWARGRGMYWDKQVYRMALRKEGEGPHMEVFGWAMDNGCPGSALAAFIAAFLECIDLEEILWVVAFVIILESLFCIFYCLRRIWYYHCRYFGLFVAAVLALYSLML